MGRFFTITLLAATAVQVLAHATCLKIRIVLTYLRGSTKKVDDQVVKSSTVPNRSHKMI